ncbi:MAG TPA: hypothetical protein VKB38_22485 [Terracidiphilus sp.]|nr:hypothetical protein [Terracidiphilus sp.]
MNFPRQNDRNEPLRNAEETLRLIAALPAPDGLAGRVQAKLRTAPRASSLWRPFALAPNGWMYNPVLRGAAAAAIVCLVAGGGWRIYSHIQQEPIGPAAIAPARIGTGGGFSSANAISKPDTLNGPVLTHAVVPKAQSPAPADEAVPPVAHANKGAKASAHKKKTAGPAQ